MSQHGRLASVDLLRGAWFANSKARRWDWWLEYL
jgi:hypothetical protein